MYGKMDKKTFDIIYKKLESWAATLDYVPVIELMTEAGSSPWQILVSTMLSARTKDEVTSKSSRTLFENAPDPKSTVKLSIEELQQLIYPVGFYKTKAKNLKKLAETIIEKYNSVVPNTIEKLVDLPGIGIKTASLVMIRAFDEYEMCVDTHVHRISNMWEIVKTDKPEETRLKLMEILPKKYWKELNRYLVTLGQKICRPMKHECSKCPVSDLCNMAFK